MIIIAATLEARPGQEAPLQAALEAMVPKVKTESGALTYTLHRVQDNPAKFFFYECYTDQNAVDIHCSTPYFKQLFETIEPMLASEPQVEFYEKIVSLEDC